jgi:nucleotide-binding universal stress UspA family protein
MPAGRPFRVIAEILRDYMLHNAIDLVVMTTHGRGGFRRGWLGSVTDSLVRDTHAPVLTVRPPRRHAPPTERAERPIRRITVPLDGSCTAEIALEPALQLASATGAQIHLLRVVVPPVQPANPYVRWVLPPRSAVMRSQRALARKYLEEVTERVRSRLGGVSYEVVAGQAALAILRALRWPESDVIVMATHGRGGAARVFLGSVADRVIRSSKTPVLVIHAPETHKAGDTIGIEEDDVLAELGVPSYCTDAQV